MPKPGYKTITISEKVYNKFLEFSKKNQVAGVNSLSGYITYLLEDKMAKDKTFAKYAPKLELISIEEDRVIIKNKIENRIAEIVYERDQLYCQLCEAKDCHCIGYAWSIPEIYEKLNSKGIRHNR